MTTKLGSSDKRPGTAGSTIAMPSCRLYMNELVSGWRVCVGVGWLQPAVAIVKWLSCTHLPHCPPLLCLRVDPHLAINLSACPALIRPPADLGLLHLRLRPLCPAVRQRADRHGLLPAHPG